MDNLIDFKKIKIEKKNSLKKIKDIYNEVYNNDKNAHSFQRYEIIKACDSKYYNLRWYSKIIYYIAYYNDIPIIIAPLRIENKNKARIIGSHAGMDYCDFIYNTHFLDTFEKQITVFTQLLKFVRNDGIFNIIFNFLDECSVTYNIIFNSEFNKNLKNIQKISGVSVYLNDSNNYENYFKNLGKQTKQNIRTAKNRLLKSNHTYDFKWIYGSKNINQTYYVDTIAKKIYLKRQGKKYNHSKIHNLYMKYFHYASVVTNEDFCIYGALNIDGHLAAFLKGYLNYNNTSIEIPRLAIDNNYNFYSPGMLLIDESIKYIYKNTKIQKFDLCRGTENYKFKMGGKEYFTYNFEFNIKDFKFDNISKIKVLQN